MTLHSKHSASAVQPKLDNGATHTSAIEFVGVGMDDVRNRYLKIKVGKRTALMNVDNLANSASAELSLLTPLGQPLLIPAAKREFIERAHKEAQKKSTFKVAPMTGLLGRSEPIFVLPLVQLPMNSAKVERYFHSNFAQYHERFRARGSLAGWRAEVEKCRDKPRMITGEALSFTGPICAALGYEPPGIQFVGRGGSGRTTAGQFVASTWGGDANPASLLPFGASWNTTVNELDYVAAAHNQTLLWLDDMENADKDSVKAIMRIMNGQGKGRMTEKRRQTFFTPLLSTANKSVVEVLRDLGFKKGFEPYIDRLMDIPLPEGSPYFFEGVATDEEFVALCGSLRSGARENFGYAGPCFVDRLVKDLRRDRKKLEKFCAARLDRFRKATEEIVSTTGRNLTRAKTRFATIFAAGCVAISYRILPFSESELLDAVWTCLRDHVAFIEKELGVAGTAFKASAPAAAAHKAYKALQRHVNANWKGRLIDLRKPGVRLPKGHDHAKAVGYVGVTNKVVELWLPGDRFQEIAGGPREARLLKQLLLRHGLLSTWASGNQSAKMVVRRPIPGYEDKWVVAVKLPPSYCKRAMK
jgi:hypothetical protein